MKGYDVHKALFIGCVVIVMSGCATAPKTSSELIETSRTVKRYCYFESREVVHERVKAFLEQCYGVWSTRVPAGGAPVPVKTEFEVIEETINNGKRLSVKNAFGVGYAANITGNTETCESGIVMYGVTGFWQRTFKKVDESAKGKAIDC